MNTIMRIMNFIKAMHCICARSPSFGASHFGHFLLSILVALAPNFACTLVTCIHTILRMIFHYAFSKMAVRRRDVA